MEVLKMIKGVNKKIIEINNPENLYFEKAVFYLKPEVLELPQQVAEDEIERYISKLGISDCLKQKKSRKVIAILLSMLLVVSSALLVFMIL